MIPGGPGSELSLVTKGSERTSGDSGGGLRYCCGPTLCELGDLSEAWFSSVDNVINNSYCAGLL